MVETASTTYNHDYTTVFNEAQQALAFTGATIKVADYNQGYLRGETGISLTSYGETIEVSLGQAQGGTWVTVQSKPSHYFTDMGKSKKNVRKFIGLMNGRMAAYGAPGAATNMPQAGYHAPLAPQDTLAMSEPSGAISLGLTMGNAILVLLIALSTMFDWFALGVFFLVIASILFIAFGMMAAGLWRLGGYLAAIGGVVTIPLGIMGIIGGVKAIEKGKIRLQMRTGVEQQL